MQGQGPYGYPPPSSSDPQFAAPPNTQPYPPPPYASPSAYPAAPSHAPYPSAPPQPSYAPSHANAPYAYAHGYAGHAPSYPVGPSYASPAPSYPSQPAYGGSHPPPYPSSQPYPAAQAPPQPGLVAQSPSWGQVALPQVVFAESSEPAVRRGAPAVLAFGLGLVAVALALGFDVLFLRVPVPRIGGCAWYLTTAFSFLLAGYGAAKWTRAGRGLAVFAVVFSALIYGCGDIGLGVILQSMSRGAALRLAVQGVAIALVVGLGGITRGLRARAAG